MAVAPQLSTIARTLAGLADQLSALSMSRPAVADAGAGVGAGAAVAAENAASASDPLYVVYDFETNGLGRTQDIRVCQVGAQVLDADLRTVSTFNEFVNPLAPIDAKASAINGITRDFALKCDSWKLVGARFNQWMESHRCSDVQPVVMLAHNGKRFDARILVFEHFRHELPLLDNLHHADTIDVFKQLYPNQSTYRLSVLYEKLVGKELRDAHTADADVEGVCTLLRMHNDTDEAIKAAQESFSAVVKRCQRAQQDSSATEARV